MTEGTESRYYMPTEEDVLHELRVAGRPQSRNQVYVNLRATMGKLIDWKETKRIFEVLMESKKIKGETQVGRSPVEGSKFHQFQRYSVVVPEGSVT